MNTDTGSISTGTPQVTAKVISNPGVSVNMTCTGEDTAVQSSEVSTLTAKVISPQGVMKTVLPVGLQTLLFGVV